MGGANITTKQLHVPLQDHFLTASFSTDACLHSVGVSVHEKKTTGQPAWFSAAAIAVSEASVSTTRGIFSSMERKSAFSISSLKLMNAFSVTWLSGNVSVVSSGLIVSENLGIRCE